ncbi:unnamed protein product [Symbiodinium natans]|uniref:Uncharacterized protein n=1 Tax=Symbiodinium natans TaxID=878477 RepID=A0A812LGN0_9DINO|nr:unnamed protein product [Symbiodinium natans]
MSHAISFKVRRWVPALTKIEDDTLVPVPLMDLFQLLDPPSRRSAAKLPALPFSLDPAVAEVIPLIDGAQGLEANWKLPDWLEPGWTNTQPLHQVSSVQCIARSCALRSDYAAFSVLSARQSSESLHDTRVSVRTNAARLS